MPFEYEAGHENATEFEFNFLNNGNANGWLECDSIEMLFCLLPSWHFNVEPTNTTRFCF